MRKKILLICLTLLLILATGSAAFALYQPGFVYRVYIDGENVGTVANLSEYTNMLEDMLRREEANVGLNLKFSQDISAKRELQLKPETNESQVKTALAARVSYSTLGWAIVVDEEPLLCTASSDCAQAVAGASSQFCPRLSNCSLISTEIVDPVEICPLEVNPKKSGSGRAVDYLLQGRRRQRPMGG